MWEVEYTREARAQRTTYLQWAGELLTRSSGGLAATPRRAHSIEATPSGVPSLDRLGQLTCRTADGFYSATTGNIPRSSCPSPLVLC